MKSAYLWVILLLGVGVLAACQASPTSEPTKPMALPSNTPLPSSTPLPTQTSLPSETPLPTETLQPTTPPLPEGVLFRDDFEGSFQPGWEWENENPAKWTFTDDGWLQIIGESNSLLGDNNQNNLLWHDLPEGDFAITAHLKAKPIENFQQATIYIYEDSENYIAVNRGYCDICSTGGGGFFMEYKISGKWGAYNAAASEEDVYLKLESDDGTISGYYALEPDEWVRIGRFGNYFQFKRVGIGVTNLGSPNDVVGLFDYFEISLP